MPPKLLVIRVRQEGSKHYLTHKPFGRLTALQKRILKLLETLPEGSEVRMPDQGMLVYYTYEYKA